MLTTIVIVGFAIIIFQLAAQRILLVDVVRQLRTIAVMMGQDQRFDRRTASEVAQAEIDIGAGKRS